MKAAILVCEKPQVPEEHRHSQFYVSQCVCEWLAAKRNTVHDLINEQVKDRVRMLQRRRRTGRGRETVQLYLDGGFSPYWQVFGLSE